MDEERMMYTPYYDLRIERKWSSGIGYALLALTVLALLGQLLAGFLAGRFFPELLESTWGLYLLSLIPMYLFAVPAYWGILQLRERTPIVKRSMGFGAFCLCFLMCMPLMYGGNLLGNAISGLLNAVTGTQTVNQVAELMTSSGMLPTVVFAVILAPIVEELVFRKLLCDRMRRYGDKIAVLVSGIAFGLYHGNLYQFFYAAAIGIFFAFLYCRTGRVSYTILLHMLVNFVGSVIPLTVTVLPQTESSFSPSAAMHSIEPNGMFSSTVASTESRSTRVLTRKSSLQPSPSSILTPMPRVMGVTEG